MSTPKISIGRIVGLCIAVIATCIAISFMRDGLRWNAAFHQWMLARPMEAVVDFSRPGETTEAFCQTCSVSHGEALMLAAQFGTDVKEDPEEVLKGLTGEVIIKDHTGKEIETVKFDARASQVSDGTLMIARFSHFPRGDYRATVRVDTGAPFLAGKPQRLFAEYQLCGLEQMPALISGAIGIVAGIVAPVAAVCVVPGLRRSGCWREAARKEAKPG